MGRMELAKWLVHWTPNLTSRVRCSPRTTYIRGVQPFFTVGHIQNNAPKSGPVAKEKAHTTTLSCIDVGTSIRLRFLTKYKEK